MQRLDLSRPWSILLGTDDEVARFAALELRDVLLRVSGELPTIVDGTSGESTSEWVMLLNHDRSSSEAFHWRAAETRVEIYGSSPKGLLNGTYSFLEALGTRWLFPGIEGEALPEGPFATLERERASESPRIAGRGIWIGHSLQLVMIHEWLLWAARNRVNEALFSFSEGHPAWAAPSRSLYEESRSMIVSLARRTGIAIRLDLGSIESFLPDAAKPFCAFSEYDMAKLGNTAAERFASYPEASGFVMDPDTRRLDILPRCGCSSCRQAGSKGVSARMVDRICAALDESRRGLTLGLKWPATKDASHMPYRENLSWFFLPTGLPMKGLDAPGETPWLAAILPEVKGKGNAAIFPWGDGLVFGPCPPSIGQRIIAENAEASTKVDAVFCSTRREIDSIFPNPTIWLFARSAWSGMDFSELLGDFTRKAYGEAAPCAEDYLKAIDTALLAPFVSAQHPRWHPVEDGEPFASSAASLDGWGLDARRNETRKSFDALADAKRSLMAAETAIANVLERRSVKLVNEFGRTGGGRAEPPAEVPEKGNGAAVAFHFNNIRDLGRFHELAEAVVEFEGLRVELACALRDGQPSSIISGILVAARIAYQAAVKWARRRIRDPGIRAGFLYLRRLEWGSELERAAARRGVGESFEGLRKLAWELGKRVEAARSAARWKALEER
jgi:hypothetical protein